MKNFKYTKNRPGLTDEEIAKRMDFNNIITNTNMKTTKTPAVKYITATILTGVAACIIIWYAIKDPSVIIEQPFINPAFANISVPDTHLTVDAEKGGKIYLNSGTYIEVPANAFADEKGNSIKGNVDLVYTEYRDKADMFISGIPMDYDSAGQKWFFESAGMFDIKGMKDNKNISIQKGKKLDVHFASDYDGDRYNLYELDTVNKRWNYMDESKPEKVVKQKAEAIPAKQELTNSQITFTDENIASKSIYNSKIPAIKPAKANPNFKTLTIEADNTEFPELAVYKDVKFEVNPKDFNLKIEFGNIVWDNASVDRGKDVGTYILTFVKDDSATLKIPVKPVFEGKDYQEALALYNSKLKSYDKIKTDRTVKEQKQKELAVKENKILEAEWAGYQKQLEKQRIAEARAYEKMQTENKVYRTFQVARFATYNCDCPSAMPQGQNILASFTDKNGKVLNFTTIYLVDKGLNSLISLYGNGKEFKFSYNPNSKTMIWAVTSDNKLAVFDEDDFSSLVVKSANEATPLKLEVADRKFSSEAEVKSYLKIENS